MLPSVVDLHRHGPVIAAIRGDETFAAIPKAKVAIRGGDGGDQVRGGGDQVRGGGDPEDAGLVDKLPCGGSAGTLARARVGGEIGRAHV